MKLAKIVQRIRVAKPDSFRLYAHDPGEVAGLDKAAANAMLEESLERLSELQERLYAQGRWSVLLVLQGMDTAGKDGVIEHVMAAVNPQGCEVHPFQAPSTEELRHDFLWRANNRLPKRGRIGIINRSYY
jgi:polyphosphate kinase 2 (PPK2 family)